MEVFDLAVAFLEGFLGTLKSKLPLQVTQAVQAAIDAIIAHKNDPLTKAAFEAQRG